MQELLNAVTAFMKAAGQVPPSGPPQLLSPSERNLRADLLAEEFAEYLDACTNSDLVEIADALADMIYIIVGTAIAHRIPLAEIWKEVHQTNMSKIGSNGKLVFREDGKVLKPEGWRPPDVAVILERACYEHKGAVS